MATLPPWIGTKFYLADGVTPNSGGKIFTYEPGTTTKKSTLQSESGAYNTNPIICNSAGEVNMWLLPGGYKVVNAPANDTDPPAAAIKTWDDINVDGTGGEGQGFAASIADLRGLDEGAFSTVQVVGYNGYGSPGGGLFYWDSTNSAADNGGTIIAPTVSSGTGRWIRVLSNANEVNVSYFGAGDISPATDTDALVAAYGSFGGNPGTIVIDVALDLSATITIPDNISISVPHGGSFNIASGQTLTIPQPEAGDYQIIYGDGAAAFTKKEEVRGYWFGANGDDSTDSGSAVNAALIAAGQAPVILPIGVYRHSTTINIPAGGKLWGCGIGSNPLTNPPTTGTLFKYTGSGKAMSVNGHSTDLRNFTVTDGGGNATHGIVLNGDGNGLESNYYENVYVHVFQAAGAIGWHLNGINAGYVAYNTFINCRARRCKTGIRIDATGGGGGFCNSNHWYGGATSGPLGTVDYGIHITSGQDNIFDNFVVEQYESTVGHVVVDAGSIIMNDVTIEGTGQPATTPLVLLRDGTSRSRIHGSGASGFYKDLGHNDIRIESSGSPKPALATDNVLANSRFRRVLAGSVNGWTLTGSGVSLSAADSTRVKGHNSLSILVPAGITATLSQDLSAFLERFSPKVRLSAPITVGGLVLSTEATATVRFYIADSFATVYGNQHAGDGQWQAKGASRGLFYDTPSLDVGLEIVNPTAGPITVQLLCPMAIRGWELPYLKSPGMTLVGGVFEGPVGFGVGANAVAASALVLPQDGNIFTITGTTAVDSINKASGVFDEGVFLFLTFQTVAGSVNSSADITLRGPFLVTDGGSNALVLRSNGNGTWVEAWRHQPAIRSYEAAALGGTAGDVRLISEIAGEAGNRVKMRNWLKRQSSGADYTTSRIHSAAAIDNGFATPGTNTRAWREIDMNAGSRHWGHQTVELMALYPASSGGLKMGAIRRQDAKGADIVAANDLTLGNDGTLFTVTGNTQINGIRVLNWQAGAEIDILFTGAPTIKHNTAASAGFASLKLNGSADLAAAADTLLTLRYDGTYWQEKGRKVA